MRKTELFHIIILIICLSSCEKVNEEPVFDATPNIKLLDISHTVIKEFDEVLSIKIEYEDGDGDLGNPDNEVSSLFVQDSRLTAPEEYYIGPLAPLESKISIKGTLNIELGTFFLLGNGTQEKTVLKLHMEDRAGNKSNILETEPITIVKKQ